MKYKYTGNEPTLLIELHKELQQGDVIESDMPLDSVFLILVEEKKKKEGDS
ncbi:hypothetical protein [Desulfosporosinus sp. SB140]|uniref:hypothetical protein n=1 Tax=Desulfosporosinus paludis TaxID=3115649 RepID=UPI00388F29F5